MRNVYIDLSSDNHLQQPKIFGGYAGEHNETILRVKLPERMIGIECSGYQFDFQTSDESKISSPLIPISKLDDDVLSFSLPEQLTVAGELFFNIAAIVSDEDTITSIAKTNGVSIYINDSPNGKNVPLDPSAYEDELNSMIDKRILKMSVGRKTDDGGEIFGDYDSNKAYGKTAAAFGSGSVAGSRYFKIVEIDKEKFLEPNPVENTPVGPNILPKYLTVIVSAPLDQLQYKHSGATISLGNGEKHFDCVGGLLVRDAEISNWSEGKITFSIDAPGLSLQEDFNPDTDMPTMLWFPDYPELGTHTMESTSFVGGDGCESTGENSVSFNTDNKSIGKHSATFGKGNLAAFAAMAINFMNKALGRSSFVTGVLNKTTADAEGAFAGGNSSTAKHPFSFVFGKFLSTAAKFQAIFGFFNQPNEGALFQVGNGIHDNEAKHWEPRTAFEVLENGSARVQTQGETADSVVQLNKLNTVSDKVLSDAKQYTGDVFMNLKNELAPAILNIQEELKFTQSQLPIVNIWGNLTDLTKDATKQMYVEFNGVGRQCHIKLQGTSSLAYPKKNYALSFEGSFEAKEGWGSQNKYCLKANYIDQSQARNVVSAKLWGDTTKSRENIPAELENLPNCGAIDGFPVWVKNGQEDLGLYTFNIPKDSWLFGMTNTSKEVIVSAANAGDVTNWIIEPEFSNEGFKVEYGQETVALASLKNLYDAIQEAFDNKGSIETIIAKLEPHIDIDSVIDYFIYSEMINNFDGVSKNYLLANYDLANDGKWYLSAYDLDSTFGNNWDGKFYHKASEQNTALDNNRLMIVISRLWDRIVARYKYLRKTVLSEDSVLTKFNNFIVSIPEECYNENHRIWDKRTANTDDTPPPGTTTNKVSQIVQWYSERLKMLDNKYIGNVWSEIDQLKAANIAKGKDIEAFYQRLDGTEENPHGIEWLLSNHSAQLEMLWNTDGSFKIDKLQSKIIHGTIDPISGGVVGVDGDVYIQIVE